jgi:acetoin utilization protein AcuB
MLAKDLINDLIPSLKLSDTGLRAMRWMEEFKLEHIPVVDNFNYVGLVSEEDILIKLSSLEQPLGDSSNLILSKPSVYFSQPLIDVVKLMSKEKIAVVPVLDAQNHYMGVVTLMDVIKHYTDSGMLHGEGGMVVLEMDAKNYSLSEIAHIVEDESGRILSSSMAATGEGEKVYVTLKINLTDLTRVISSFERRGYLIKESHHQSELMDDLKNRYDSLMNYLNI